MNARFLDELKRELQSRGFGPDGTAPKDTMTLDDTYLSSIEIGELFDMMIARREKAFKSSDVVGADAARNTYDDVVLAIDAIKAIVSRLTLP